MGQPELGFLKILHVQRKAACGWAAGGSELGAACLTSWHTGAERMIDRV